jgi:hypothetical protein
MFNNKHITTMKKTLLLLCSTALLTVAHAQTIFDDWETSGTRNINYYNSGGGANYISSVTNPSATGVNTSAGVGQYVRVAGASPLDYQLVGCAWSVPAAWSTFNMSTYDVLHLDVYASTAFTLRITLKDDDGAGGGTDLLSIDLNYTASDLNTWKTLDYDFSAYKNYTPSGKVQVLYLFNPGTTTAGTYYVDNFKGTLATTTGVQTKVNDNSKLDQNSPNPFSSNTSISYSLKQSAPVSLTVYDALGTPVSSLLKNVTQVSGDYNMVFNAETLKEGVYYYTLTAGEASETKRMLIQK